MGIKSSKIALGVATLITAALALSGCSSSDNNTSTSDSSSSETTSAAPSANAAATLSNGAPFSGKRITLSSGSDADAPAISVSLPAGWTRSQDGATGNITDILSRTAPEPSGFTPKITLTVENQGTATAEEILAGAHSSFELLDGWSEVKYADIEVDGQKAIRVAGTWTPPASSTPVYSVMTVIAYQLDENSPVYLVNFANHFTDVESLATSDQIEEINTSIEFG